ncbi:hypothetical protein ACFOYW_03915 [Gryllotalpicola reticulitermitis]|uniref:Uncharacterized protein n=1 Tax=Gryllotalpicola reticulitermitis TaxID=1184153 RepID=A0ABV8Q568_9MICO
MTTKLAAPMAAHIARRPGELVALTVRIPIHTLAAADILEVPVLVHELDANTTEVLIDGSTVGYIHFDGHHFVALSGPTLEAGVPCGAGDLWDQALGRLYEAHRR